LTARTDSFDDALLESIDETIRGLFDQEVLEALYSNLRNTRSLDRDDIPHQIPVLSVVLEKYFESGAPTIMRFIARRLYSRLDLRYREKEGYTLADYVRDAKHKRG
jgi:hypothetical protein